MANTTLHQLKALTTQLDSLTDDLMQLDCPRPGRQADPGEALGRQARARGAEKRAVIKEKLMAVGAQVAAIRAVDASIPDPFRPDPFWLIALRRDYSEREHLRLILGDVLAGSVSSEATRFLEELEAECEYLARVIRRVECEEWRTPETGADD
jgi:hypothetical protein